jgi:cytoskeletal protein RodZ
MKTIGKLLKDARAKKRYSLAKVEEHTKIKQDFIRAIESQDWKDLPDYTVVVGFVKNIAGFLGVSQKQATALLRRDYPPQKLTINPKPDVSKEFRWSPRLTFVVGVAMVIIVVLGYLGFQYIGFVSPPRLEVFEPREGQVVKVDSIKVSGQTNPDAVVKANNQPILVNEDGAFSADINIFEGTSEIVIKATSRSGKETTVHRNIKAELN